MTDKVILLTSGTTWTVPSDFTSTNTVVCIGPGATGVLGGPANPCCGILGSGGPGGAGGAWASVSNLSLTPLSSINIHIGAGGSGTDTWFNGTTLAGSSVGAKSSNGTTGGSGASSIGTSKNSGGNGGANGSGGVFAGGGGGAGGPNGAGAAGAAGNGISGGAGGNGDAGSGGAGGTGGSAGSPGTEYTITAGGTAGSGGGGGAAMASGGAGGNYGAGGAGAFTNSFSGGVGAPGVIIVTYTPNSGSNLFGQSLNYDQPNPRGYQRVIDEKVGITSSAVINTLLNVTYFTPGNLLDQPNPNRGAFFNRDIVNFNDPVDLLLLGKDQMVRGAGFPDQNYDWPVPKGYVYPSDLKTYTYSLNCWYASQTAYYTPGMGMPQLDWPVPKGYQRVISEKTWVLNNTIILDASEEQLLGFKGPWRQTDFPVPKGYQRVIDLVNESQNLTLLELTGTTFYGQAGMVPPLYDWPVPKGRDPGVVTNRTHTANETIRLTAAHTFFRGYGIGPNYDYPNPRGYKQPNTNYNINQRAVIFTRSPYSFSIIMG